MMTRRWNRYGLLLGLWLSVPSLAFAAPALAPPTFTFQGRFFNSAGTAPLTDVNPDPNIVEVSLAASPSQTSYLDGKVADVWAYRDAAVEGSTPAIEGKGGRVRGQAGEVRPLVARGW